MINPIYHAHYGTYNPILYIYYIVEHIKFVPKHQFSNEVGLVRSQQLLKMLS